jgi:hypothetical protein
MEKGVLLGVILVVGLIVAVIAAIALFGVSLAGEDTLRA